MLKYLLRYELGRPRRSLNILDGLDVHQIGERLILLQPDFHMGRLFDGEELAFIRERCSSEMRLYE